MPEAKNADTRSAQADAGPIRFFDLETPKKMLRADIEKRWLKILDHGAFIGGPEVTELEAALAALTGSKHALAVASGTDALVIALMGEGVKATDAVFIPGFTYNATANAVLVAFGVNVPSSVERACKLKNVELQQHKLTTVEMA